MTASASKTDVVAKRRLVAKMLTVGGVLSFVVAAVALIVGGVALLMCLPAMNGGVSEELQTQRFQIGMAVALSCAWCVIPFFNLGILLIAAGAILKAYFLGED